jgi:putative ABC transport system substrate-binding protein
VIKINLTKQIQSRQLMPLAILLVVVCLLLSGCGEKEKVYSVGILAGASGFLDISDGFKTGMTELGYIEGENIIYDVRESNENRLEEQRIAKKFVEDKVDLIFAFSTEAALIAKAATNGTGIPVVFAMGTIEETGLVESVRAPGGNITGVRFPGPDILLKGLEDLLELAPNTKRIWIILESGYPASISAMEVLRPAASSKGLTLIETNISSLEDLKAVLEERAELADIGIDAIKMAPGVITLSPAGFAMISKFAAEHKVPIEGGPHFAVEQGAVFTSVPDNVEMGKLAATLADKIFKGTPAGTIPVVTPETQLWINYKVIQELGLTVPEGLLNRADEIIR